LPTDICTPAQEVQNPNAVLAINLSESSACARLDQARRRLSQMPSRAECEMAAWIVAQTGAPGVEGHAEPNVTKKILIATNHF